MATWDAMLIYTSLLIMTIQIANKLMMLGADDNHILNRAQTRIIFSRLVLTKSRRCSCDLSDGLVWLAKSNN